MYFALNRDEVVVERGVWWKMRHTVPYSRIMSVDIIQGPISRMFNVGSVHIHTAGYTGPFGGSAGPGVRGAEAVIWGVQNFNEVREMVLSMARGRPLFAEAAPDISQEILTELRRIREALEKGIN
ncbi:MAG: PH domain-containing protein [Candidatus Bathyarchaeia archaeon]